MRCVRSHSLLLYSFVEFFSFQSSQALERLGVDLIGRYRSDPYAIRPGECALLGTVDMAHKLAKQMLEDADNTFLGRAKAVEVALSLGMTLREIEVHLDWLEIREPSPQSKSVPEPSCPSDTCRRKAGQTLRRPVATG